MAGIARALIDYASTHTDGDTHSAPGETKYAVGSGTVFVNGYPAVRRLDVALCGDIAIEASSKVFVNGRGVHRLGDSLDSHAGTYSPSVCVSASSTVFAS